MTAALEITVSVPVTSFRNPVYAGVQVGLPCPPPSTVGGFLASAAGGWARMPEETRFAMSFTARGSGSDLETYHPLDGRGMSGSPVPRDRDFLAGVTLTLWLADHLDLWETAMRRPVWPLRLGRSQDLASARTRRVELGSKGPGRQGQAVVPSALTQAGTLLRLPTAIAEDRSRTRWDAYRYARTGGDVAIDAGYVTSAGQAVALLPPSHPDLIAAGTRRLK
jgi:CRISPR-associated Cas5-like protein